MKLEYWRTGNGNRENEDYRGKEVMRFYQSSDYTGNQFNWISKLRIKYFLFSNWQKRETKGGNSKVCGIGLVKKKERKK